MTGALDDWLGRTETRTDTLRPEPARFMQATLDRPPSLGPGDALPPLWHWLYFLHARPLSELGRDAHPRKGGFMPPVSLPRRMWAGGRLTFHAPLTLGMSVTRRTTIQKITEKTGRSGDLCFVTLRHELLHGSATVLTEEQDIVYRGDPDGSAPGAPPRAAPQPAFSQTVQPSAVMLFRYSALTFNGHRIHYDVDYARDVEGYGGLVFHGPLTATLLAGLAQQRGARPLRQFDYRGHAPISGLDPFRIEAGAPGETLDLWARRADGAMAMTATARF